MSNIYSNITTKLNKAFPCLHVTNKELEIFHSQLMENEFYLLHHLKLWCNDLPKEFVHAPTKTDKKVTLRDIWMLMVNGFIIGRN